MSKKMTKTEAWMLEHPDDEPPPKYPRAWREQRFVETPAKRAAAARANHERAKYEAALAEMRNAKPLR